MLVEGKEEELKRLWEIARWEQYMQVCISPDIKPHNKPTRPDRSIRFPWETKQEDEYNVPHPLNEQQKCTLNDIMKTFYNQRNG